MDIGFHEAIRVLRKIREKEFVIVMIIKESHDQLRSHSKKRRNVRRYERHCSTKKARFEKNVFGVAILVLG